MRAYSSGVLVADADPPLLVWEHPYYPQYFFAPGELAVDPRHLSARLLSGAEHDVLARGLVRERRVEADRL